MDESWQTRKSGWTWHLIASRTAGCTLSERFQDAIKPAFAVELAKRDPGCPTTPPYDSNCSRMLATRRVTKGFRPRIRSGLISSGMSSTMLLSKSALEYCL